jgi:hypothetical protein
MNHLTGVVLEEDPFLFLIYIATHYCKMAGL